MMARGNLRQWAMVVLVLGMVLAVAALDSDRRRADRVSDTVCTLASVCVETL